MLEEIHFLLNMKFDSVSPVALILAGQPELWKQRLSLKKKRGDPSEDRYPERPEPL